MRIIAGQFKGRRLGALKDAPVRPTADRTREAVFSILGGLVSDASVLDLFAGTGALGLESLSRGAARAVFVDSSRESIALLRRNISLLGVESVTTVLLRDALRPGALAGLAGPFDLVFADPPYKAGALSRTLSNLAESGALAMGATVVAEHSALLPPPVPPPSLALSQERRYGKSLVSFFNLVL